MQLTLFELPLNEKDIEYRLDKATERIENVRKGIYFKHAEIRKMCLEMKNEFEQLKQAICKGDL